ncbi:zinc transporter ZIP9-like [Sinocyclocheilus rhinocerous]|uniref:zinc transporter ZIP9-like n=1 Tax=Sinocyclocheilus rhinocerous TaxID=307959 RepID=UPI0007B92B5E|nr:PREDICTED: zinc transporter ZIP9-like [Sinocyclocheilus rhinocerous]
MDDFSSISLLSLAMLVGCYVAGTIPLAVNFSEEKLKLVTVLGAGLLCGTALAVIIPEGVHALYEEILEVCAPADGVALGAAASTSQTSVQLIVFVAIMLHKAPAAFGLVSFLMHAGLERNRIRKHLLVFALAAPVLAMLTYAGLSQSSKEALSDVNATGVAMLFSAGTFLYVATVHVLPEVGGMGGHSHSPGGSAGKGLSKVEVGALVLGCLIPLVLSIGHQH